MTNAMSRVAAAAMVFAVAMAAPAPPAYAYECTSRDAQPSCIDDKDVFIDGGTQSVTSRQLGHYCEDGETILRTRIKAIWQDVTRKAGETTGYLSAITIRFEGDKAQHLGALDAYSDENYFNYRDHETDYPPGSQLTLRPRVRVRFHQNFVIAHKPWRGMIGATPGGDGEVIIPCGGPPHEVLYHPK